MKYFPMVIGWLAKLQKNGAGQGLMSRLIDLKQMIQRSLKDLDVLVIHRIRDDGMPTLFLVEHMRDLKCNSPFMICTLFCNFTVFNAQNFCSIIQELHLCSIEFFLKVF